MDTTQLILLLAAAYLALGLIIAVAFAALGVHRVDPAARGSGLVFRLMIVPGCTLLWPLIVNRWIRVGRKTI